MTDRPDIVVLLTDDERAAPPSEPDELREWRTPVVSTAFLRARRSPR